MKLIMRLLMLAVALLAVRMAGRAFKRDTEVMAALWALTCMTALAGAGTTPKARSTETRLNILIPKVFPNTGGTINGSVTVNGGHSVNGNMSVSGSHTVGGQVNAGTVSVSGAATSSGFTSHGNVAADSHVTAGGNVSANGNVSAGGQVLVNGASTSAQLGVNGSAHITGNHQVDGTLSAGNFSGTYIGGQAAVSTVSSAPGSYSSSYENTLASAINGIISRLGSSGLI